MTIKNALITGPTHGIGRETALELARQGFRLYLLCRNAEAGQQLCNDIAAIPGSQPAHLLIADLGNFDQVRAAAQQFLDSGEPLHVLINNAGVVNIQRIMIDGLEQMFRVNHLGHFLLTQLLLPRLIESAPSRIVVVSSNAHAFVKGIQFDDLSFEHNFATFKTYGHSKLGNLLMAKTLSQKLHNTGVTINSLHPGAVSSNIGKNNKVWYNALLTSLLKPFFLTPRQGAQTSIYLATAAIESSGDYYYKKAKIKPKPWAEDTMMAERLWEISEQLTGLSG